MAVSGTSFAIFLFSLVFLISIYSQKLEPRNPKIISCQLENAWKDLEFISKKPHPYSSHAHDEVREYILNRLNEIINSSSSNSNYFSIIDDQESQVLVSSHSSSSPFSTYFEGANILFYIKGSDYSDNGTLVSGHIDSVQTSYGTTDDGHSVAIMLALAEKYSKKIPKRPLILNFNTGEELGLFGAHCFFKNNLSKIVQTFLNIEGAGAGGKAVVFRATDSQVLKSFSGIHNGKGNVLYSDAYKAGVVASWTDFEVYSKNNLRGLDMAFVRRRYDYHTPRDNIKQISYGSLFQILSNTEYIVDNLLNNNNNNIHIDLTKKSNGGAFFDIFEKIVIVISNRSLYFIGISLIILFIILPRFILNKKYGTSKIGGKGWLRLPLAILISIGISILASFGLYVTNSAVLYSSYIPFLSIVSLFIGVTIFTLILANHIRPVQNLRLKLLIEQKSFFCILLILTLILQYRISIGSTYIFEIIFLCTAFAEIIYLISLPKASEIESPIITEPDENTSLLGTNEVNNENSENESISREDDEIEEPIEDDLENTNASINLRKFIKLPPIPKYDLWLVEAIFSSLIPLYILGKIAGETLDSLAPAMADGKGMGAPVLYALTIILSFLVTMIVAPYLYKSKAKALLLLLLFFIISYIYSIFIFPFNELSPLKVYVGQHIDLSKNDTIATFNVYGLSDYLPTIVNSLPSVQKGLETDPDYVTYDSTSDKLLLASFPGLNPTVLPGEFNTWLNVSVDSVSGGPEFGFTKYSVTIETKNSRGAFIRLLDNNDLARTTINLKGYSHKEEVIGSSSVVIWSRKFDHDPLVLTILRPSNSPVKVQVGVYFNEWLPSTGAMPAFDEFLHYMPSWANFAKRENGLLVVSKEVELV